MKMMTRLIASALLLCASVVMAHDFNQGGLHIDHPWSRPLPPTVTNGTAFMVISNHTDKDDQLLSARSPLAQRIEIHTHEHNKGVMQMRKLDTLAVPAGGSATLQPGGHHLMLMGLNRVPQQGERFPVVLEFANAGEIEVQVSVDAMPAVKPVSKSQPGDHQHH